MERNRVHVEKNRSNEFLFHKYIAWPGNEKGFHLKLVLFSWHAITRREVHIKSFLQFLNTLNVYLSHVRHCLLNKLKIPTSF